MPSRHHVLHAGLAALVVALPARGQVAPSATECDSLPVQALVAPDGRGVYVEPQTLSISTTNRVLILGNPTFQWVARGAGDSPMFDSLAAGVVVEPDGGVTLVPHPAPGTIDGYRAIRWGDEWAVLFATVDARDYHEHDDVLAFWFGITDGRSWHDIRRMPAPPGTTHAYRVSQLARSGERVAFVVPNERMFPGVVWRYDRDERGRWDLTPLAAVDPGYASLDRGTAFTRKLAVVEPDAAPGEVDVSSLMLYRHDSTGAIASRLRYRHGLDGPIYEPSIATLGSATVVAYSTERPDTLAGTVDLIDSSGAVQTRSVVRGRMWVRLIPYDSDSAYAVAFDTWTESPPDPEIILLTGEGFVSQRTLHVPFKRQLVSDYYHGRLVVSGYLRAPGDQSIRQPQTGLLEIPARCRVPSRTDTGAIVKHSARRQYRVEAIYTPAGHGGRRRM